MKKRNPTYPSHPSGDRMQHMTRDLGLGNGCGSEGCVIKLELIPELCHINALQRIQYKH